MPPNCTPEKRNENYFCKSNDSEAIHYFSPEKIPSTTADENENKDINQLLCRIPKLNNIFNIHHQVGEGTFSKVYLATMKQDTNGTHQFAIKHISQTCHPDRIKFELKCLLEIGGKNNVAGINLCLRHEDTVVFVMPYQNHRPFHEYINKMDLTEIGLYMKNLLMAVAHVHKFGIIHRDIKPSNFLYDRTNKTYLLVDFGLAQYVSDIKLSKATSKRKLDSFSPTELPSKQSKGNTPRNILNLVNSNRGSNGINANKLVSNQTSRLKENNPNCQDIGLKIHTRSAENQCHCYGKPKVCSYCLTRKNLCASRAGTPGFRPPEVLLKYSEQTTAVDIWAVGIIMVSILSGTWNFFSSPNDISSLAEIISVFGSAKIKETANNLGRHFICSENISPMHLQEVCQKLRQRTSEKSAILNVPETAYELLNRLLDINPATRITAEEALQHKFFTDFKFP